MELIKKLRDISGAGIVDCQKALQEANNDLEVAVDILRKKGIAKAGKRSDREAAEGLIKVAVSDDAKIAYILELNSETDFVARNEKFQYFADQVLNLAKVNNPDNLEDLLGLSLDGLSVADALGNLSGTIGEKLELSRYAKIGGESVAAYSHLGGKIGVIIALDKTDQVDLASDLAMHVAAANPKYIESSEVPEVELDRERDVYREQLLKEGKDEKIIDNIMVGKINKYYSEVCLLDQEYIKDDKNKVKNILGGAKVLSFLRYSL